MAPSPNEKAAKLKEKGSEAFQNKEYDEAIKLYGEAIAISNCDHLLYSNRSAAYAGAKRYEEALVDAQKCVELKPDFAKGYGRVALAQFHLNQVFSARKSYREGLKHDSQSQVLKNGLRDTEKNMKGWFLSVLTEVADVQSIAQQRICEATHQLVADGVTSLSFLEAHQHVLRLNLPRDTLEKCGLSEEDCQQTIADYDKARDYEVCTAAQNMFMPSGKGDSERSAKLGIATVLDAHKFMEEQMKSLVEEFNQLPAETKHSIPKKEREHTAELQVSLAVESSLKIQSEDLEMAVNMLGEQLQEEPAFGECQVQLGSLMHLLMEPPYIENHVKSDPIMERQGISSMSATPLALSRSSTLALNVGIASAVGLVVVLGLIRWRAKNK